MSKSWCRNPCPRRSTSNISKPELGLVQGSRVGKWKSHQSGLLQDGLPSLMHYFPLLEGIHSTETRLYAGLFLHLASRPLSSVQILVGNLSRWRLDILNMAKNSPFAFCGLSIRPPSPHHVRTTCSLEVCAGFQLLR